jgi:site-specific recombinase
LITNRVCASIIATPSNFRIFQTIMPNVSVGLLHCIFRQCFRAPRVLHQNIILAGISEGPEHQPLNQLTPVLERLRVLLDWAHFVDLNFV